MSQPICLNRRYILRVYTRNAILFNQSDHYDYRILNQVEKDILTCVDGVKGMNELLQNLCIIYAIEKSDKERSNYQLLKRQIEQLMNQGVLIYENGADGEIDMRIENKK